MVCSSGTQRHYVAALTGVQDGTKDWRSGRPDRLEKREMVFYGLLKQPSGGKFPVSSLSVVKTLRHRDAVFECAHKRKIENESRKLFLCHKFTPTV